MYLVQSALPFAIFQVGERIRVILDCDDNTLAFEKNYEFLGVAFRGTVWDKNINFMMIRISVSWYHILWASMQQANSVCIYNQQWLPIAELIIMVGLFCPECLGVVLPRNFLSYHCYICTNSHLLPGTHTYFKIK